MNWKAYIKIFLIIAILAVIALAAYWFFSQPNTLQSINSALFGQKETPTGNGKSSVETGGLNQLTAEPIFDYWINDKDNSVYYLNEAGSVYKISGTENKLINSQTLGGLNKIQRSRDGNKISAKFNYPNFPIFSIFDASSASWQPIPGNILSLAWSPISDEIMYLDHNSLNILNLTTQKPKKLLDMTQKDLELNWLSDTKALFSTTPTIYMPTSVWTLDTNTKTITAVVQNEYGLTVNWLKNGSVGIKLNNIQRNPVLSAIDKDGNALATFTFVTLPSKCAGELEKIYCAIPKNIPEGAKLPDDYYKKAVYFDDAIYAIDIKADTAELLFDEKSIDAEHLELFNNTLLFKNRLDEKLYSLKIK